MDPARVKPVEPSRFLAEVAPACDHVMVDAAGPGAGLGAFVPDDDLVSDRPAASLAAPPSAEFEPAVPAVLSFSHLHTYQLCPYRFYLQYLLGLPGRPSRAADEGVRVHAAIERLAGRLRAGEQVPFEEFAAWASMPVVVDDDRAEEVDSGDSPGSVEDALRHF